MPAIRRILCPLDFSRFSRHALEQAVALGREFGAEISALHVFHAPIAAVVPMGGSMTFEPHGLPAERRAALTRELREFTHEVEAGGLVVHTAVDEGEPVAMIIAAAAAWPADLIVMGTHGRTGFERLLLGSVAEKVLRQAPCPVVTVPRRVLSPARALSLGRLLCPVDFSAASMHALDYASMLAVPDGPGLCVLNVIELFEGGATRDTAVIETPDFRSALRQSARERLEAAISPAVRARCPVVETIAMGQPSTEIVRVAAEQECDAIVLGVKGRSAADLLLFGSTAQGVVRHAGCPVLTLRA